MSRRFVVTPRWLSVIAFIVNDGDAGLCGFPQSRRLAAVTAVIARVAVDGADCTVYVVTGSVIAIGDWVLEGNAIMMIPSAFCRAAAPISSASAGLEIFWFIAR